MFEPVTTAEYGLPAGHWRQTVTTGNGVTKNYFDALWRKRVTLSQDTAVASTLRAALTQYDSDGRVTFQGYPQATVPSITDTPKGTTTVYDPLGREISRTIDTELSPAQRTATNVYQSGFTIQTTDFNGNVSTSSFQAYDNPDKAVLASLSGPEGLNLSITRDAFGATTSMTKNGTSAGVTTSVTRNYVYDGYHQLCKTVEPELGATVQDWDAAGNLAWRSGGVSLTSTGSCDTASVPAAQKISYGYDARNRLTSTTFGDSSPAITRTYTDDGLIATLSTSAYPGRNNATSWTYTYNNRRLMTKESLSYSSAVYDLSWGYDANGNVSALTYPDGALVNFNPNALGEPTAVNSRVSGATYWPNGAVKSYTLGNGITHTVSQNVRGLPSQITDGSVLSDQYSYDANGNVLGITDLIDGSSTRTMQYDGLNRLKTANGIWGSGSYTYDVQDNIRSSTVGSRVLTHSYDAATNRLTGISGTGDGLPYGYTYDANGNINNRTGYGTQQTFAFDLGNRINTASSGGTTTSTYSYDGNGRRVEAWNNADSTTQSYVYDHTGVLRFQRIWTSGAKNDTKYLYLGNRLVTEVNSAGTYTHEDALGSPVARTNDSAALISKTRYEPYGNVASGFVPTKPDNIGFTGHVFDSNTGLVQMQQRYYDPIAGRFLSTDPVVADVSNGGNFGRYTYVDNNPYAKVDPTGMLPEQFLDNEAKEVLAGKLSEDQWKQINGARAAGAAVGLVIATGGQVTVVVASSTSRMLAKALNLLKEATSEGTTAAKGIGARVEAVHGALDPIAAGRRTTAALDTVEGTRVLAAGGRDLSPAQRALMESGEVAAKLPGAHAEVTALQHAAQNGLTPAQMAVSRTICPTCRAAIEQSGGQLTSPTTAIWPR
ncbi:RHS repeat-associated core domain-containing protein [Ideonella sp. B508-1]|uniref:RHS repeat-associated core domain-containing protein n=1 Tax=Ideonella sp. B508-1 TaxID=137716 RepID=UPI00034901C5|nr:RHS repeat-associated core domain-containing protein [Ideonella sp. B508-1]